MEEQKENVYFGCLPTPESGICSGTGGEEEEKKELSKIEREMEESSERLREE
jgi:hypothetical protein